MINICIILNKMLGYVGFKQEPQNKRQKSEMNGFSLRTALGYVWFFILKLLQEWQWRIVTSQAVHIYQNSIWI